MALRAHYPDLALFALRPGAVIIDVGANIGQFAESALAFQPLAQVHCFEPVANAFTRLTSRLRDLGDIHCNRVALDNSAGERELVVRRFDQCTSFLELGEAMADGIYGLDLSPTHSEMVTVQKLSGYVFEHRLTTIDLLKLDVQGFELEVLRGAETVLPQIRWIYAEAQFQEMYAGGPLFHEIAGFLHARGFDLVRMTSFRFDDRGDLLECDMIFRNRMSDRELDGAYRR